TPRQLPGLDSVGDALLLANLARVHAHPFRVKRTAVILRHPVVAVLAGEALMRNLFRGALHMPFAHRNAFLGRRPRNDAARAIEADVVDDGRVADHGAILVHAVEAGAYAPHCGVVAEDAAFPASAVEPDAAVPEAIIDSAVEANVRPPVAGVPTINATHKAPITGPPQEPRLRRHDPQARHP